MKKAVALGLAGLCSCVSVAVVVSCVGDESGTPVVVNGDDASAADATGAGADGSAATSDAGSTGSDGGADAAPNPAWTLALTSNTSFGQAVVEAATGDIYVGGLAHGDVPELGIKASNGANDDALLVKIQGTTGKILWATSWGGSGDDSIGPVVLGGGTLYVVGSTTSASIGFPAANPGSTLNFPSTSAPINRETFIAQVDPASGKATWAYTPDAQEAAGTSHFSLCEGATFTNELYVGCSFVGAKFNGNLSSPGGLAFGGAVLKMNSLGTTLGYARHYSTTSGSTLLEGLGSSGNGFVYNAFNESNVMSDVTDAGSTAIAQGFGPTNAGVMRFPELATGDTVVLWKGDSTNFTSIAPFALALTTADVYAIGVFNGSPAWDAGASSPQFDGGPAGQHDLFVADLPSSLGSTSYVVELGGSGDESAGAIAVDGTASPSLWIGGTYQSTDFVIAGQTFPAPTMGTSQGFFAKLSLAGAALAATPIVSQTGNASVSSLAPDNTNGYLIVGGTYNGAITFDDKTKATSAAANAGYLLRRKM